MDGEFIALAEEPTDAFEGNLVRVLKEGVQEAIPGPEGQPLGDWLRRVELLPHRLDQGARELDEGGRRHRR